MNAAAELHDVNYCALALALISDHFMTVEAALDVMSGEEFQARKRHDLTDADTVDMINMRPMPYWEIAEMYGLCDAGVWRRIKNYKERLKRANN